MGTQAAGDRWFRRAAHLGRVVLERPPVALFAVDGIVALARWGVGLLRSDDPDGDRAFLLRSGLLVEMTLISLALALVSGTGQLVVVVACAIGGHGPPAALAFLLGAGSLLARVRTWALAGAMLLVLGAGPVPAVAAAVAVVAHLMWCRLYPEVVALHLGARPTMWRLVRDGGPKVCTADGWRLP